MSKKHELKEQGITLIALVVTIIILLILAGVTLSLALSQNGLFSRAQNAADRYKKAQENEVGMLAELEKQFGNMTNNNQTGTPQVKKPLVKTVTDTKHNDVEAEDSLGNPVVIPGGFKFAGEEGDTVEDGIVIEDGEGNQFVWIPVSNTNGDNNESTTEENSVQITKKDKTKVEITLRKIYV